VYYLLVGGEVSVEVVLMVEWYNVDGCCEVMDLVRKVSCFLVENVVLVLV